MEFALAAGKRKLTRNPASRLLRREGHVLRGEAWRATTGCVASSGAIRADSVRLADERSGLKC
jgi:hypothetical protein